MENTLSPLESNAAANSDFGFISVADIEIFMLTYNEEEMLPYSLAGLRGVFTKFTFLDMESSDRTTQIIKDVLGENAQIVPFARRDLVQWGYAHARNFGVRHTRAPWVLVVDADEILVAGVCEGRVRISEIVEKAEVATVERRNLRPRNWTLGQPLTAANAEVYSVETHRRLYRPDAKTHWQGYIHESLFGVSERDTTVAASNIILDHFTRFRDPARLSAKNNMYSWMLMRAYKKKSLQRGTNRYWYDEFVAQNLDKISSEAKEFSQSPGGSIIVQNESDELVHGESGSEIEQVSESAVFDLSIARRLHRLEIRQEGFDRRFAYWCEWNHPQEASRSLAEIVNFFEGQHWRQFLKPSGTYIDIGGHSGDTAITMAILANQGYHYLPTVLVIEPNPAVFEVMRLNLALNEALANFVPLQEAVTKVDFESVEIVDHSNGSCNGGIIDDNFSPELWQQLSGLGANRFSVQGRTLATICRSELSETQIENICFIKIDCEGYDKEILRSSKDFLQAYRPVIFLEWFAMFSESDSKDLFSAIEEVGYVALNPVTLEPAELERKTNDLLLVRSGTPVGG